MPTKSSSGNVAGKNITLELEGGKLTIERFKKAVNAFFDLVESVSEEVSGSAGFKPEWIISVEEGSARVIARPVASPKTDAVADAVIAAVPTGLKSIQKGTHEIPLYFNPRALKAAKKLATVRDLEGQYVSDVKIRTKGHPSQLSLSAVKTIDRLMGIHQAIGSIEGKLQTISERGNLRVIIYDDLFDRGVQCYVDDRTIGDAIGAFGKRVLVFGEIQYNKNGFPVSIRAEALRVFRDIAQLPSIAEMKGLLSET